MKKNRLPDPHGLFGEKEPIFIAHRGYTPVAPENSLASFKAAADRRYWAIETDVHETLDGVLVCCHNFSLSKMFGVSKVIEEHTFEELSSLRIVNGNGLENYSEEELRLPLFDEYLEICKEAGCVPFIETKGDVVEKTILAVMEHDLLHRSVFSSAKFDHILEARRVSKEIFIHHIFSSPEHMKIISELGYAGLSYNYPVLDDVPEGLIEMTHEYGVRVCLRPGDTRERVERMMAMGLDYIPTNCSLQADYE